MSYNGLQLGEVAEIEAQMFGFVQKFNRSTAVEFSTEPAILPNCCVCLEWSFVPSDTLLKLMEIDESFKLSYPRFRSVEEGFTGKVKVLMWWS